MLTYTWNLKHSFISGCFSWMIQNLYIGNDCFTKHPFKTGCLGFQVYLEDPGFELCFFFGKPVVLGGFVVSKKKHTLQDFVSMFCCILSKRWVC